MDKEYVYGRASWFIIQALPTRRKKRGPRELQGDILHVRAGLSPHRSCPSLKLFRTSQVRGGQSAILELCFPQPFHCKVCSFFPLPKSVPCETGQLVLVVWPIRSPPAQEVSLQLIKTHCGFADCLWACAVFSILISLLSLPFPTLASLAISVCL